MQSLNKNDYDEMVRILSTPRTVDEWRVALSNPNSFAYKIFMNAVTNYVIEHAILHHIFEKWIELLVRMDAKEREEIIKDQLAAAALVEKKIQEATLQTVQQPMLLPDKVDELKQMAVTLTQEISFLHEQQKIQENIIKQANEKIPEEIKEIKKIERQNQSEAIENVISNLGTPILDDQQKEIGRSVVDDNGKHAINLTHEDLDQIRKNAMINVPFHEDHVLAGRKDLDDVDKIAASVIHERNVRQNVLGDFGKHAVIHRKEKNIDNDNLVPSKFLEYLKSYTKIPTLKVEMKQDAKQKWKDAVDQVIKKKRAEQEAEKCQLVIAVKEAQQKLVVETLEALIHPEQAKK
ncbi:MAG: hypothetical protein ACD_46C00576G0003 [uncultured bacterium]|nr:MAG: hypothetical protein ACD_46C00576G0003 [uncultured bacterium]